jgi:hypothetical protein
MLKISTVLSNQVGTISTIQIVPSPATTMNPKRLPRALNNPQQDLTTNSKMHVNKVPIQVTNSVFLNLTLMKKMTSGFSSPTLSISRQTKSTVFWKTAKN